MKKIGVIGAGAFGSALSFVSAKNQLTKLYGRSINIENPFFPKYPSISLPTQLILTNSLEELSDVAAIILAIPTQSLRDFLTKNSHFLQQKPILLTQKGIEKGSQKLVFEIFESVLNTPYAVLSGPNFAIEILEEKITATTIASKDNAVADFWINALGSDVFRPYKSNDVVGTQLSGAMKNIIAIACGVAEGLDLGRNAHAAIQTRGLAEIVRLGIAMGANLETFMGLSGVGDLTLTCSSSKSRNMSYGYSLAHHELWSGELAEGVHTSYSIRNLAHQHNVKLVVCETVAQLLAREITLGEAIKMLTHRPFKKEF